MNSSVNNIIETNSQTMQSKENLKEWSNFQNGPAYKYKKPQNSLEFDSLIYTCKDTSIAYLWMWLFEIIFVVVTGVFFAKILGSIFGDQIIFGPNLTINLSDIQNDPFYIVFTIMLAISIVWGFIILVLGIALAVKTYKLNKIFGDCGSLWILFLIGIFLVFPGIVGAFITIMTSNWLMKVKR